MKNNLTFLSKNFLFSFASFTFGQNFNIMQNIKLTEVIEEQKLDRRKVAEHLFPSNKYATSALKRVESGEALLNADQITRLAAFAGVTISSLWSGEGWKARSRGAQHVFTNAEYFAEVNMDEGRLKIYHNKTLFHDEVLFSKAIPLRELMNILNKLILEHVEIKN